MANLYTPSLDRATDQNGNPLSGAKLYFMLTETDTLEDVFTDGDGMTVATNPVVSDAYGMFDPVYLDPTIIYRAKLTNSSGSESYYDVDPVNTVAAATDAEITEVATSGALLRGVHTIPVLVGSMIANTTNGAASGTSESATNDVMLRTLDFDASTDESAQITIPMPKSWNEGTVTVQFIWTAANTGNVVWGCAARAFSDDDAIDQAFGTAQTVTDGVTAAGDFMESAFTSPITIAGTPAAEDLVIFKFYRDANDAADTCAVDAKLIAVRIKYTIDAGTDA